MPKGKYVHVIKQNVGKYAVGTIHSTSQGDLVILEKFGKLNGQCRCTIRFIATGYTATVQANNISSDKVKDQRRPSVCGIGYLDGIKIPTRGTYVRRVYDLWANMLRRVTTDPLYADVTIATEWLSFKTFLNSVTDIPNHDAWESDPSMHLDKDSVVPGNRIYSLSTCSFISAVANTSEASLRRWASVRS